MSGGSDLTWARFLEALPDVYLAPIVTGGAAGLVLGFLGVYVVLRRMVFISAALSQVSGVGVALAFWLQIHAGATGLLGEPVLMALLLALLATLFFRPDPARLHLSRDSLLGLVYVVAGGVALFLGTRISQEAHDIRSILFGVGVAVRAADLWMTVGVGAAVLAAHVAVLRGLAVVTFDPVNAAVQGLPVRALDTFLFFSVAVAVAVTTRALGALPVFGLTVLPAMAALALVDRLTPALLLAAGVGAASGVVGYVYAFFTRFPVGASQTVIAGVLALAAMGLRLALAADARPRVRVGAPAGAALVVLLALWPLAAPSGPAGHHHHGAHHAGHGEGHGEPAERLDDLDEHLAEIERCEDPERCSKAIHALGHHKDPATVPLLVRRLAHEDWGVRAEAADVLGVLAHPDAAGPLAARLATDDSPWVRAAVATALGRLGSEQAREALTRAAARETDPEVRRLLDRTLSCVHAGEGGQACGP